MHKDAILGVHIVQSLRIAIHAGRKADSRQRGARRRPAGSDTHGDLAAALRLIDLLVVLRTIWSSACCGGQRSPRVILVLR
jgi:hypothetical protein